MTRGRVVAAWAVAATLTVAWLATTGSDLVASSSGAMVRGSAAAATVHTAAMAAHNRDRGIKTGVPEVEELADEILNATSTLRWAVFVFDDTDSNVVATAVARKTHDWGGDWAAFVDALPEKDAAFGLYAFEYWVGDNAFSTRPTLFSWAPDGMSLRERALGGYYLPGVLEATDGVEAHYSLGSVAKSWDYVNMCRSLNIDGALCQEVLAFHDCPFTQDESEMNPCRQDTCAGAQMDLGAISEECCSYIETYCEAFRDSMGCHPVSLHALGEFCQVPLLEGPEPVEFRQVHSRQCDEKCRFRCADIPREEDRYLLCSTCDPDSAENDGYLCYPGAVSFYDMRCCGDARHEQGTEFTDPFCLEPEQNFPHACANHEESHNCAFVGTHYCEPLESAESEEHVAFQTSLVALKARIAEEADAAAVAAVANAFEDPDDMDHTDDSAKADAAMKNDVVMSPETDRTTDHHPMPEEPTPPPVEEAPAVEEEAPAAETATRLTEAAEAAAAAKAIETEAAAEAAEAASAEEANEQGRVAELRAKEEAVAARIAQINAEEQAIKEELTNH